MTEEPPSPLLIDHARLLGLLGTDAGRFSVDVLAECASTNSHLLDRATAGAPSGTVVVADRQTAGRGSRGRSWLASPEASLTFSVLWHFPGGIERLSGLSLAVVGVFFGLIFWLNQPDLRVLYSNLPPEDASRVVKMLQADKVHYKLENNGATVLVYLLLFALLGPAILDELLADGAGMLAALLAAGNLSFWLCDRAVGALTRYYRLILKKKLKFWH